MKTDNKLMIPTMSESRLMIPIGNTRSLKFTRGIVGLNSVRRGILSSVTIVFMIESEDGKKRRGDFFWSVGDFSFENDTIGHIFTRQYYGLQNQLTNYKLLLS